jgi:antitoxin ParD1/3/4
MNIIFSAPEQNFIKAKINEGRYSNATELVRAAIRLMRAEEKDKATKLKAALDAGMNDVRQGRTTPYTKTLMNKIVRKAHKNSTAGRKPNPDVCD